MTCARANDMTVATMDVERKEKWKKEVKMNARNNNNYDIAH